MKLTIGILLTLVHLNCESFMLDTDEQMKNGKNMRSYDSSLFFPSTTLMELSF